MWNSDIFTWATAYITNVHYEGPLALAVDDTKLLPALRVYYDNKVDAWFLVGGLGDPVRIANEQEMRQIIKEGNIQKATKVTEN